MALNPATPPGAVSEALPLVGLLSSMSVNPGFGGQTFIDESIDKVRRLRQLLGDGRLDISVDGGVDKDNAGRLHAPGPRPWSPGSAVFGCDDRAAGDRSSRSSRHRGRKMTLRENCDRSSWWRVGRSARHARRSNPRDKRINLLVELANLDKQTIFDRAEELYADEEYEEARELLLFVYDTFPNDPLGHKAALRVADTYSIKNDTASLTEARLRYRDFANRYPNDPDRDYALLMLGHTYAARKLAGSRSLDLSGIPGRLSTADRPVSRTPVRRRPRDGRRICSEILAEHEWHGGHFLSQK